MDLTVLASKGLKFKLIWVYYLRLLSLYLLILEQLEAYTRRIEACSSMEEKTNGAINEHQMKKIKAGLSRSKKKLFYLLA